MSYKGGMHITYIVVGLILLVAMVWDLRTFRIPNGICIIGLICGLATSLMFYGVSGLLKGVIGMVIPVFILFILYLFHFIGAGDIKLLAVLGSFYGYEIFHIILYSFLAGAILAFIYLVARGKLFSRIQYFFHYIFKFIESMKCPGEGILQYDSSMRMHFSIAIFLGYVTYLCLKEGLIEQITYYLA